MFFFSAFPTFILLLFHGIYFNVIIHNFTFYINVWNYLKIVLFTLFVNFNLYIQLYFHIFISRCFKWPNFLLFNYLFLLFVGCRIISWCWFFFKCISVIVLIIIFVIGNTYNLTISKKVVIIERLNVLNIRDE